MLEDNLSPAAITTGLQTSIIGKHVIYLPVVTSTNDVAREAAMQGAADGTVAIADEQTAGRGRIKRAWISPRCNVAASVILRPGISLLPSLIMLASISVVHAITAVSDLKPCIKWPNDVLISGKKVCGILIENSLQGNKVDYAVMGIGINVNIRMTDHPEVRATATSLSDEMGRETPRLTVVRQLLQEMDKLYLLLRSGSSLYEEWRDSLVTLGQPVRVTMGQSVYEGIAESVATDGSLLVRQADNSLAKVVAGDATLRRNP
jgi:BirA family biotin operon repressor/biotin-[acetyl-CoA-carboxylase] ligase